MKKEEFYGWILSLLAAWSFMECASISEHHLIIGIIPCILGFALLRIRDCVIISLAKLEAA